MVEKGKESYGLGRSPNSSLASALGIGTTVEISDDVAIADDAATADDVAVANGVAAMDGVVVAVGVVAAVVVWVQWCWMTAYKGPQSRLVSVVVTLRGRSHHDGIGKQPRAHIQQWGGWYVVNHGVHCRDNIGEYG